MVLEIVVMVKQVPDSQEVVIDPVTMNLNRSMTRNVTNRADENALEAALQIKDKVPANITIVSMGPPQAETTMIECLARGADRAVLVSDRAFGGADTYPTGLTVASAISKLDHFDIIIAGEESSDSSTGHVGPGVAEFLGIDQITYCSKIEFSDGRVTAERELEDGTEVVQCPTPVLVTMLLGSNFPRMQTLRRKIDATKKGIEVWNLEKLGLQPEWVGVRGSPTIVRRMQSIKERERAKKPVTLEAIPDMVKELYEKNILKVK
ncbi:MAG: electron transfer flavoprotein subunit beta/FixA family protein [Candidatus Thermoplasmatota archaeon]|nr:electron transfer flavoprotein subunit beta/FixA family protein [Candidatus Thermoplasmatota archaeon]MCL5800651.1 electron transfer flavoprotein subunit beta/FixA family protein [Candidatus Thermoplasmatota archaeon]